MSYSHIILPSWGSCGPHTLNLIGQTLLWGIDADAYDNKVGEVFALEEEHKLMRK
jgi:hypothetical protein